MGVLMVPIQVYRSTGIGVNKPLLTGGRECRENHSGGSRLCNGGPTLVGAREGILVGSPVGITDGKRLGLCVDDDEVGPCAGKQNILRKAFSWPQLAYL